MPAYAVCCENCPNTSLPLTKDCSNSLMLLHIQQSELHARRAAGGAAAPRQHADGNAVTIMVSNDDDGDVGRREKREGRDFCCFSILSEKNNMYNNNSVSNSRCCVRTTFRGPNFWNVSLPVFGTEFTLKVV